MKNKGDTICYDCILFSKWIDIVVSKVSCNQDMVGHIKDTS
jgi:hypothetical protein